MGPLIITRGITAQLTYKFYEPLATKPRAPDYSRPIDLTGLTIRFVIESDAAGKIEITDGILTNPAAGRVDITLTPAVTAALPKTSFGQAYLKVIDGLGNIHRRGARRCVVV